MLKLASDLITRHTLHFRPGKTEWPTRVANAIRDRMVDDDMTLAEVLLGTRRVVNGEHPTLVALEDTPTGAIITAKLNPEYEGDVPYRRYLDSLRAVYANLAAPVWMRLDLEDELRTDLRANYYNGLITPTVNLAGEGVVIPSLKRDAPVLLQSHPAHSEAFGVGGPSGIEFSERVLILYLENTPQLITTEVRIDHPLFADIERPYDLVSTIDRPLLIGPAYTSDAYLPLGEGYGNAVIDALWFREDPQPTIAVTGTEADAVAGPPLMYRLTDYSYVLPIDHSSPTRLRAALEGIALNQVTRNPDLGMLAAKVHLATPSHLKREAALADTRAWVGNLNSAREARLKEFVRGAVDAVQRYQTGLVQAVRTLDDRRRELHAIQSSPMVANESDIAALARMLDSGVVTSFTPHAGDLFTFTTRTLYCQDDRSGAWHELGRFKVTVNLSPEDNDKPIVFMNLDIKNSPNGRQALHVFSDGRACEGNFIEAQTDMLLRRDWLGLIEGSIAFLESANTDDIGDDINQWPFVAKPEEVGLPPYEGYVEPYPLYDDEEEYDDEDTYDENGFNRDGVHHATGDYYDEDGYDVDGYDEYGWNRAGINEHTGTAYDENGYDVDGYNEYGFDRSGYHESTHTLYNEDGYNQDGYDEDGYDVDGHDRSGRPREQEAAV